MEKPRFVQLTLFLTFRKTSYHPDVTMQMDAATLARNSLLF